MNSINQAVDELKKYYSIQEFKEVNLNMEDFEQPYIRFKCNGEFYKLILIKEKK